MNMEMTRKWVERVKPEDTVYFLGDFAFTGITKATHICNVLTGQKIIICGNHDRGRTKMKEIGFDEAYYSLDIVLSNGIPVKLSHYPIRGQEHDERKHFRHALDDHGGIHIHGHTHSKERRNGRMIHVGCDAWDYAPVHEREICVLAAEAAKEAGLTFSGFSS